VSQFLSFFSHVGPGFVGLNLMHLNVAHHLVVEGFGMVAGALGVPQDGIQRNVAEATGGSHAVALGDMGSDVDEFRFGQLRAVERGAVAFGKILAAAGTAEAANVAGFAGPTVGPEIALASLVEQGTLGVGTGESGPITLVHDALLAGFLNVPTV
jgi:hypothetical protein